MTAHQLAMKMVREVLAETGETVTASIGTNMYLAKIAMDIYPHNLNLSIRFDEEPENLLLSCLVYYILRIYIREEVGIECLMY